MQIESLKVTGMQSDACAGSVRQALQSVPGVSKVDVTLSCNKAVVEFDEGQAGRADMLAALKKAGFGVIGVRAIDLSGNGGGSCCGGCCG